jgi:hypothetical protein
MAKLRRGPGRRQGDNRRPYRVLPPHPGRVGA